MSLAVPNPDTVTDLIRDVAAQEIMPRFRNLSAADIREKKAGDVVTTADIEAEKRLSAALQDLQPGSAVVGEEGAAADPGVIDALGRAGPVWVIDPVDGTQNFADGHDCFAVIIAYCVDGETRAGWIHDPVADTTLWAVAGEGTWNDGTRLTTTATPPIADMRGTCGPKLRERLEAGRRNGNNVPSPTRRLGCAGREYMDLVRHRFDFAVFAGRLKPWDHAAGVLIHREAGGFNQLMNGGGPYIAHPEPTGVPLLLAPDEATWETLHRVFDAD
jgi:fructose-1,6-bisphosphatase/inositol monophosphatase family enzyme